MPGVEWMPLVASEAVQPGEILGASAGGHELVVWRARSGGVCVMDARCPHQWTHLGDGGVVDGDELVCTSHFWRFDRDGCGSKLTVLGRRDPKADIEVHRSRERDGMIEVLLASSQAEGPPQGADGVAR